ncbi:unnamed protein product [Cylicostephanus goldi]|uniref:Uncharacterized protein n=1 Tax=Cylicostephanus goldi TaxID=71465 RepID=A0A3P7NIT1_CYLGO|nr:unnamed protein product [Cylicostephanus goldi]
MWLTDGESPLNRSKARVLRDIWESCEDNSGGKPIVKSNVKKYEFKRRLSEFNNTIRVLEAKLQEAVWKEEYKQATEIEGCLKRLRSREAPLLELLKERHDAIVQCKYSEAEKAKIRFENTLEDALQNRDFEKFLKPEEVS